MTATNPQATTVQGAPRRLVEDAWKSLNRRYAIGTLVLLAALLLLWLSGNGPGAWRAAATDASSAARTAAAPAGPSRDAGGGATSPAAPPKAPAASAPGGAAGNGGTAAAPSAPVSPAPKGPAAAAPSGPAPNGSAPSTPGTGPSAGGGDASLPKALPGAPVARIFFEADQAWPSGRVGPTLAPVLARLKAEPDTKALVSGFHDRRGSAERNAELALRRAQAVRRVLIREGVAAERIVLAKPQQAQGSGSDREARRVEVTVAR